MKIFSIQYDRTARKLLSLKEFELSDAVDATGARLQAELDAFRSGRDLEVVLLEAPSVDTLHLTHAAYFERADELLRKAAAG